MRISAQSFLLEILTTWPESEAAVRAWEWLDRTGVADRDDFVVREREGWGHISTALHLRGDRRS